MSKQNCLVYCEKIRLTEAEERKRNSRREFLAGLHYSSAPQEHLGGKYWIYRDKERLICAEMRPPGRYVFYKELTSRQWEILGNSFSMDCPLYEFSGTIPPRVVEACDRAMQNGEFKDLRILSHNQDFLLLGWREDGYCPILIAWWGDVLKPWSWFVKQSMNREWKLRTYTLQSLKVALAVFVIVMTIASSLSPMIIASFPCIIGGIHFWEAYIHPRRVFKKMNNDSPFDFSPR